MKANDFWSIITLFILVIGVFAYSYILFDDFSVTIIIAMSSMTILFRVLPWSYNDWLSVEKLGENQNNHKVKQVKIIGNNGTSINEFSTTVEDASKPKEVEQYFNFKISKKETENYVIDLTNNLLSSIFPALAAAAAAFIIGFINKNNPHTIDQAKLMYAFIPISWQLSSLIAPFLHIKKRNEKALIV